MEERLKLWLNGQRKGRLLSSIIVFVTFLFFILFPHNTVAQQCERVSIAGSSIWFPYAYVDSSNKVQGIGYDIVKSILQEMGYEYEVAPFIPWKRIQQNLTQGKLDILASNHWTEERAEKWNLSSAIGREDLAVFTLKQNAFEVEGWLSLVGKEGVVSRGTALGAEYEKYKSQLSLLEIGSHENGFTMLSKGFVDYLLLTKSAARPFLNSSVMALEKVLYTYPISISFSKRSPCSHLYPIFEELLKQRIASGWLEKRKAKYAEILPKNTLQ